jgi:citrate synthase
MAVSKKVAVLSVNGKKINLPVIEGTEGQFGIDISTLKRDAGAVVFDNGFANSSSTLSTITFVDGDAGILRYRGYNIEDLVDNCSLKSRTCWFKESFQPPLNLKSSAAILISIP